MVLICQQRRKTNQDKPNGHKQSRYSFQMPQVHIPKNCPKRDVQRWEFIKRPIDHTEVIKNYAQYSIDLRLLKVKLEREHEEAYSSDKNRRRDTLGEDF